MITWDPVVVIAFNAPSGCVRHLWVTHGLIWSAEARSQPEELDGAMKRLLDGALDVFPEHEHVPSKQFDTVQEGLAWLAPRWGEPGLLDGGFIAQDHEHGVVASVARIGSHWTAMVFRVHGFAVDHAERTATLGQHDHRSMGLFDHLSKAFAAGERGLRELGELTPCDCPTALGP